MRQVRARQQGQVIVAVAFALAMVATSTITLYLTHFGGLSAQAQTQEKKDYLLGAAVALRTWYEAHPVAMDATATPDLSGPGSACVGALGDCLLQVAGVSPRFGVRLEVGKRQFAPAGFPYRRLTVWIPKASVIGAARSHFTAANALVSQSVDGHAIQQKNYLETQRTVASVAIALQAGYGAWLRSFRDTGLNWFQPPGCGAMRGVNKGMTCANSWEAASGNAINRHMAWAGPTHGAWGQPIEVCNTADCGANDGAIPFNMLVRVVTPWGQVIQRIAVEPIQTG